MSPRFLTFSCETWKNIHDLRNDHLKNPSLRFDGAEADVWEYWKAPPPYEASCLELSHPKSAACGSLFLRSTGEQRGGWSWRTERLALEFFSCFPKEVGVFFGFWYLPFSSPSRSTNKPTGALVAARSRCQQPAQKRRAKERSARLALRFGNLVIFMPNFGLAAEGLGFHWFFLEAS